MSRVLIIEDEVEIADLEKDYLELSGFEVEIENDGTVGLKRALTEDFDMYILDLMLPGIDGFEICKQIREEKNTPILMVSARQLPEDRRKGFLVGTDDYITKPFKLNELLSRIKALLRRSLQFSKAEAILEANGIRVDTTERLVWKNGEPVDLPLVEYKLLCLFMQNPNHLMPREMILDRMWDGNGNFVDDNTLSVYIRRLRNKVEDTPNAPKYLLTERGIGYKWVVE